MLINKLALRDILIAIFLVVTTCSSLAAAYYVTCSACGGSGACNICSGSKKCPVCEGSGVVGVQALTCQLCGGSEACHMCSGSGKCWPCSGTGNTSL